MKAVTRLAKLRALDAEGWRLLAVSVVAVPLVQWRLQRTGFGAIADRLARSSDRVAIHHEPGEAEARARRAAKVVAVVANRRWIGAPCLGRSLELWWWLRRQGIDAELAIGAMAPNGEVEFAAHAWVEVEGVPVNDAADVGERFGRFPIALARLRGQDGAERQAVER